MRNTAILVLASAWQVRAGRSEEMRRTRTGLRLSHPELIGLKELKGLRELRGLRRPRGPRGLGG